MGRACEHERAVPLNPNAGAGVRERRPDLIHLHRSCRMGGDDRCPEGPEYNITLLFHYRKIERCIIYRICIPVCYVYTCRARVCVCVKYN